MPPGDPAALLDADTGNLEWLPVNGTEQAQIAHVHLRRGELDDALRRYDQAAATLPADGKADWMFFRAIALEKAGRFAEAQQARQRFELRTPVRREEPRPAGAIGEIIEIRHRFAAEAF